VIQVVHADVLECLDELPPFDALITDPPYSPHVHDNATSAGTGGRGVRERDLGFDALTCDLRGALASLAARANRWSCVFSDFEGAYAWMSACDSEYIRTVPWVRWSQPQLSGDRPCTGAEAVLVFHALRDGKVPMRKRWNGPGSLVAFGVDYDAEARTHAPRRALRGKDKHPTEKPLDLMLDLVSWFSDPGELVLDPCAGSGTTALACRLLGRSCLALERDPEWARRAAARVEGAPLSDRDRVRAQEWVHSTVAEADRTPAPKAENGSDVKTYERAQRRIEDAGRVGAALIAGAA
jgi:site-specific DNA-methyltransferase (adenine-specific)